MSEWLVRVGATGFMAVVCEGCLGFAVLGTLFVGACLGTTLTLGVDFAALPLSVVSRSFRVGFEATGQGVGLGGGGEVALITQPHGPRGSSLVPNSPVRQSAQVAVPSS
jgi:hypothetical protein